MYTFHPLNIYESILLNENFGKRTDNMISWHIKPNFNGPTKNSRYDYHQMEIHPS